MSKSNSTITASNRPLTVAYLRRSSPKQADSLDRQRELIREYAARHGLTIDRELRDSRPGDEIDRRQGLQELLQLVQARQVGIVIVDEWSRLGRGDPDEVIACILLPLKRGKVQLHTVKEGLRDLHGMAGRILNTISASQASEEVINLSRRVAGGKALLASQGRRMGGVVNYGYLIVREAINIPGRGPKLVPIGMEPDPEKAHWVQYIFRRYTEALIPLEKLARELDALGAPPPRGDHWTESGVRYILAHPVYLGSLIHGRRITAKYHTMGARGEGVRERDPDERGKYRRRPGEE